MDTTEDKPKEVKSSPSTSTTTPATSTTVVKKEKQKKRKSEEGVDNDELIKKKKKKTPQEESDATADDGDPVGHQILAVQAREGPVVADGGSGHEHVCWDVNDLRFDGGDGLLPPHRLILGEHDEVLGPSEAILGELQFFL